MSVQFPRTAIHKTGKGNLAPLVLLIVIIGAGLRLWSASGDFWVDEAWSLDQMRVALTSTSPRDVVALFFHANTHALNTLYMALVQSLFGNDASDYTYRSLSVIAGVASVIVAARIGARWSAAGSIIAALLIAFSFPLINYAGEARGYSTMIFAALASYYLMLGYLEEATATRVIAFILISIIGLMSHLTFVVMQAGLGVWAACAIYGNRHSIISTTARLIPLFGIQFLTLVAYGAIALDSMVRGGDCCPEPALLSIGIMAGLSLGFDAITYPTHILLVGIVTLCLFALLWLSFRRDQSWIMMGIVIVVFPATSWWIETSPDVIHRYYLLSAVMLLMLMARILNSMWQRQGSSKLIAGILICVFIIGNSSLLIKFKDGGGRGQYRATLTHILQRTDDPQRLAVWPTFSVRTVLNHHIRQMHITERISIINKGGEKSIPADWYVNGYLYGKAPEPEIVRSIDGYGEASYRLSKTFTQWGLSGDTYALYQLVR
jgi:hypothetical protein